jgi:iron complex transport system ATP-binding protein
MKEIKNVIELRDISVGYRKGRKLLPVLENITTELKSGEMVCLIGENGIGKSTLIRTISGVQPVLNGTILINGKELIHYHSNELAKTISLVLTDRIFAGNLSVEELIALGRYPHTNWLGTYSSEDHNKINWALDIAGLINLKDHIIHELSDGQFQKALIARALAQDSDIIILDEPTIHLDLTNKISVLKLLKDLSLSTGKSILLATHELDLGFQIADRIWMILDNRSLITGVPEDLILNRTFHKLIKHDAVDFDLKNGRFSVKNNMFYEYNLDGDPVTRFWTSHALKRNHWKVTQENVPVKIKATTNKNIHQWEIKLENKIFEVNTIEELIYILHKHIKS